MSFPHPSTRPRCGVPNAGVISLSNMARDGQLSSRAKEGQQSGRLRSCASQVPSPRRRRPTPRASRRQRARGAPLAARGLSRSQVGRQRRWRTITLRRSPTERCTSCCRRSRGSMAGSIGSSAQKHVPSIVGVSPRPREATTRVTEAMRLHADKLAECVWRAMIALLTHFVSRVEPIQATLGARRSSPRRRSRMRS